jgi:hypothetical protein
MIRKRLRPSLRLPTFGRSHLDGYPQGFRFIVEYLMDTLIKNRHYRDVALILISTPAGRLNLFKASMVFAVACLMSINRL